ncbi:MAG TPA: DNA primase [Ignavibacteriaceae bacterium]|nr:DNA primase [Ignavibacteriaceae bacterium]
MQIPEHKIEEIRQSINIVDVISPFVQLRKRGRNYLGLCPFHTEKTPSFTVSEEKQIFHCFGCHTGGNVFKFLMEYEKISFLEAVQELAAQAGIALEADEWKTEKQSEQEVLYDINTEAARYFLNNLLNTAEGEIAAAYFRKRNIKLQTMRAFGLGYALNGWDKFVEFAKEKRIDLDKALQLGLIIKGNDGRLHDRFSSRIIFPIFSPNGRVVAFAGRLMEEREGSAKYLNSPESSVYHKGSILYGLSHAKDEIRKLDKAILVEGYMDLISLYQSGVKNAVAVSGTALTEEQIQLLSRYTKNVVLLFDADTAGIKASMRSIELLLKKEMEIKIVSLPSGEDPDSFVNKFGREKFEELIKHAENFLEYQTEYFQSQGLFDDPAKAAEAIRDLVKPAALISDELKRNLLIKSIAKKFNLREMLLEAELEKILKATVKTADAENKRISEAREIRQSHAIDKNIPPEIYNLEKELIKLLLEGSNEVNQFIMQHLDPEEFCQESHRKLIEIINKNIRENSKVIAGSLIDKIQDENLKAYILEITFEKYSISKNWEEIYPGPSREKVLLKYAVDTVRKFKIMQIEQQLADNLKKMENSTKEESESLMLKKMELEKQRRKIKEEMEYRD